MYVVVNRIQVAPGRGEEFAASFAESMSHLDGVPGLRRSTLLAPATPDGEYLSTMEFDSPEHFQAWRRSDSFAQAHAAVVDSEVVGGSSVAAYDLHTEV
ncbi:MAG: antibiotic biosynthesis monooxygenase [Candidatus Nanopelagicales bacterium]